MGDIVDAIRRRTSSLLVPTSTSSGHHAPLPTVVPTEPIIQEATEVGHRMLW